MARGIVLGLGVALAKRSRNTLLRNAAGCYIWLFRSLPLLVLLIFIFNLPQIFRQPAGYCRIDSQPVCWR
ncbi:ABC transporter permease subunit [Enterobacter hormaechei]